MANINVEFSRELLKVVLQEVKAAFPDIKVSEAWVYKYNDGRWEFHGPNKYYWYGRADNAYDARYKGWVSWLETRKPIEAVS